MSIPVVTVDATDVASVYEYLQRALRGECALIIDDPRASQLSSSTQSQLTEAPDDTALIIQTSGTTGSPKSVALSAAALRASAEATAQRLGGHGQWVLALPLSFIAGAQVVVRSVQAGTRPEVVPEGPFDADHFAQAVEQLTHHRKYSALVPVQLARVVEACENNPDIAVSLRKLDAILIGGQALDSQLRERAQQCGLNIVHTYGSSETAGGCVYDGIPLEGVEVEVDPEDNTIALSGPVLAEGYLGDDQRTADVFQIRNGKKWFLSEDTGVIDNGILTVGGRRDRTIISGGIKINLDAVEALIHREYKDVEAYAVYIPDMEWGSRPAVIVCGVEPDEHESMTDAIHDLIRSELGRAADPALVRFIEVTPLLPSGKIDRHALTSFARGEK
jgi:O-succinylbenzoic acid--CoA ligase